MYLNINDVATRLRLRGLWACFFPRHDVRITATISGMSIKSLLPQSPRQRKAWIMDGDMWFQVKWRSCWPCRNRPRELQWYLKRMRADYPHGANELSMPQKHDGLGKSKHQLWSEYVPVFLVKIYKYSSHCIECQTHLTNFINPFATLLKQNFNDMSHCHRVGIDVPGCLAFIKWLNSWSFTRQTLFHPLYVHDG